MVIALASVDLRLMLARGDWFIACASARSGAPPILKSGSLAFSCHSTAPTLSPCFAVPAFFTCSAAATQHLPHLPHHLHPALRHHQEITRIRIFKELFIQRFESLQCFLILLHGSGILQLCAITFSFGVVVNSKFGKDFSLPSPCLRTS
jgi:hypothetical protein